MTSQYVFANFGGAMGADMKCQTFADNAQLGGTWMAWISDSMTSPAQRFTQSLAQYVLVDGTPIAANWFDLTSGALPHPINEDEHGVAYDLQEVWTGTGVDGFAFGANCSDWSMTMPSTLTGQIGRVDTQNVFMDPPSGWTNIFDQFCNRDNVRMYCFEQ
jgi:hypothetical protein